MAVIALFRDQDRHLPVREQLDDLAHDLASESAAVSAAVSVVSATVSAETHPSIAIAIWQVALILQRLETGQ
jgi:hypothetical protein